MAVKNNIEKYIVLDCRKSELEWIKNSIMNSELPKLLNFNEADVDWSNAEMFALFSNTKKEICDYWKQNSNLTPLELENIFGFNRNTITRYLKFGTRHGWCSYDVEIEKQKRNYKVSKKNKDNFSKRVEVFKDGISFGIFNSAVELDRQSEVKIGVKLSFGNICAVCRGKRKSHKGFTFRYVDYTEQPTSTEQQN